MLVAAAITDRTRGDGDGQAGESTHWIPGRSSQRCVVDRSRGSGGRRSPDRLAHQASSSPPTVVNGSRRAQAVHLLPRRRARRVDAADTHATWWHSPNSEQGVVLAPATALPSPRHDQGSVTGAPSGEEDAGDMRPWVGRLPATCGSSPPSTTVSGRTSRGCVRSLCWRCSPTTPASARSPAATVGVPRRQPPQHRRGSLLTPRRGTDTLGDLNGTETRCAGQPAPRPDEAKCYCVGGREYPSTSTTRWMASWVKRKRQILPLVPRVGVIRRGRR